MTTDALTLSLAAHPDRCRHGYHLTTQHPALCPCPGLADAADGMALALGNTSDARRVEDAIRQLAAAGKPFSANDARLIHGVRGGVVGATFNALRAEKVIRPVGEETSTDRGTHGKRVALWVGI